MRLESSAFAAQQLIPPIYTCDGADHSPPLHWHDIPPETISLALICNDFGRLGYGGPCPPSGVHGYVFKLYALDTWLGLKPGASKVQVEQAMAGHILEQTELVGCYGRSRS